MKQLFLALFLGAISCSFAQSNKHFNLENGLAIQGYDPVAYFNNRAVKGDKKILSTFHGTIYSFSTKENKKSFELNPLKYEPQYGGWCAFAMGDNGKKVEIDPETFKIIDGKLYLFYNAYFNNTLKSWNKDEINLKLKANKNWSNIIKH
jgi:hypothetical protein